MPERARVVAWGAADAQSALDLAELPDLNPVLAAGFEIEAILSPAEALAAVVRARRVDTTTNAVAAVSLNARGAAMAVVSRAELIASRMFDWPLGRPFQRSRSELLDRCLLVAQLAPQLQHLIDLVRPVYGANVASVIVCGTLPSLRSLSMLLVEELDLEVETLDSADLLEPNLQGLADGVAALQLAAAAATDAVLGPERSTVPSKGAGTFPGKVPAPFGGEGVLEERVRPFERGASSLSVLAIALVASWFYLQLSGTARAIPTFSPEDAAILAWGPADPPAQPAVSDLRIEATMGRFGAVAAPARSREGPAPTAATLPTPAPVASAPESPAPLPRVDGIMISADRRLAIVDGNVVAPGDRVGPRSVARIERDGVVLREASGREVHVAIRTRKPPPGGTESQRQP
jgi:hypothetical protein